MSTTPTKLNIMNAALRKVGSYFLDESDTTSTTYQIANQAYLDAILEIFSENVFTFNTRSITDTAENQGYPLTDEPYKYTYVIPDDFNTLLRIEHPTEFYKITDYSLEQRLIHTNEESIRLVYTYIPDLESPTSSEYLPPYLNRLIVLHIAQALSIELSGSENRHEILFQQYMLALRRARVVEARQGPTQTLMNDSASRILGTHRTYGTIQ